MDKNLDISKVLFRLSCVLGLFVYGIAVGAYHVFPYSILDFAQQSVAQVFKEKEVLTGLKPTNFLKPARYEGNGVTILKKGRAVPGLTFVSGFFSDHHEMRLVRLDGSIVHRWPVKFFDLFSTTTHIPPFFVPKADWNTQMHGSLVLPDGSVILNFEYMGTAKLDRCGALQWTIPRVTHHSVERSEDGGFWIPSRNYRADASPFPLLKPPYFEDTILKVSKTGDVLSEISVPRLFFESNLHALLFSNGLDGIEVATGPQQSMTHLNDVEELNPAMAGAFPRFAAGDLLLSMRNLNLIMVIDPRTQKVKWHQTGPWLSQHDPDFQSNGRISVFSNNNDGTANGSLLGGSTILEVDPVRGETTVRYGARPTQRMYSDYRSMHQNVVDGAGRTSLLITESYAGRVFEVDSDGEVVWELINRYDEDEIAVVNEAFRLREDFFTVPDWSCN